MRKLVIHGFNQSIATFVLFVFCVNASWGQPHRTAGSESKPAAFVGSSNNNGSYVPADADPKAARLVNKGIAEVGNDNYDAALAALNAGYAIDPRVGNKYFYDHRRAALTAIHRYKEALADASRAIELDPQSGFYFNGRGQIYMQMNQYDLAVKDFIIAESLIPRHKWTPIELGHCYDHLGQFDKSVASYSKALAIDPSFVKAYEFRASAYEKLGKKALAAKDRKTASSLSNGWAADLLENEAVESRRSKSKK